MIIIKDINFSIFTIMVTINPYKSNNNIRNNNNYSNMKKNKKI